MLLHKITISVAAEIKCCKNLSQRDRMTCLSVEILKTGTQNIHISVGVYAEFHNGRG